ncbi:hypothetical protein ACQ4PT_066131 [Festuca glaucescens]
MASPPQPAKRSPAVESYDILWLIFLKLDSAADLARACAASPAFRRVITDPRFLRDFHALHPPPLLGIINNVFLPAEQPHPSASAAHKLISDGAIDFSCKSFLPTPGPWYVRDSRDGRVLCSGLSKHKGTCCGIHRDLARPFAVCDPLRRRYRVLPAIPEELAATLVEHGDLKGFTTFLAPPAEEEEEGCSATSAFRVMCVARSATKLVLFVFSSSHVRETQWQGIDFDGWSGLFNDTENNNYRAQLCAWTLLLAALPRKQEAARARRAGQHTGVLHHGHPSHAWGMFSVAYVEAAGEQGRVASVTACKRKNKYHLRYDILQGDNGNGDQREPEVIIHLPSQYCSYCSIGVAGGYTTTGTQIAGT